MRISFLFIVIFLVLCAIVVDWQLSKRLKRNNLTRLKNAHIAFSALIYVSLAAIAFGFFYKLPISTGCFLWVIFTTLTVIFSKVIYGFFIAISKIPKIFKKDEWKIVRHAAWIITSLFLIYILWSTFVTPNCINIQSETIVSKKVPSSFDGYKIVHFSDLHTGIYGNNPVLINKLVNEINDIKPDLIIFTGDIVNHKTDEIKPFIKQLKRLKATDGVVSVLGNHDYGDYAHWNSKQERKRNLQDLKDIQTDSLKWTLLNNRNISIKRGNKSITVIGVENWGEPPYKKHGDLKKAMPKDMTHYNILLTHNPRHWEDEVVGKEDIDLTLSGHTHAMQTIIGFGDYKYSPASLKYKYWGRLYNKSDQYLNVNTGIGEVGLPVRFGATPEISLIILKSAE